MDRNDDVAELQRQYRNMESNRKAYAEESKRKLYTQQQQMEKLRKDNEALKEELALEQRNTKKTSSATQQSILAQLHDQGDMYTQKIEIETRNIKMLEDQIQLLKQKVLHQRKHMGGVNAAKENQQMINKQIRILENRLDKALIKFNEALAHNKQLRESIDNLRRERVVFDNIYRKLEKELFEKKKQMANIIELSNLAYEQRDAAQLEIAAIEQANKKEQEEFYEKMEELNRQIDADNKRNKLVAEKTGASAPAGGGEQRGELSIDEERKLKSKVNKGAWNMAKDKVNIQVSIEKVQNFEEAFNRIKAATGISDIEELVKTFIKNEDQNFSLFNYVNEQTNEIEKLEEQMQQLRDEEQKYTQESGDDVNQHKQLLKDLEIRLQATETMAEKYEMKCADSQKTINSLKAGIQSIFNKIECNSSAMADMLSDTTVTEANIMQFLGMIEQRTNEILQQYASMKRVQELSKGNLAGQEVDVRTSTPNLMVNILGIGPATPMGGEQLQINPPNLEDYSSEDESDDSEDQSRPYTRDELKSKTLKGIHRRKKDAKASGVKRGKKDISKRGRD